MKIAPRPLLLLHDDPVLRERVGRAAHARFDLAIVSGWEELRDGVSSAPPAAGLAAWAVALDFSIAVTDASPA